MNDQDSDCQNYFLVWLLEWKKNNSEMIPIHTENIAALTTDLQRNNIRDATNCLADIKVLTI